MQHKILALDQHGYPTEWIRQKIAITYHCKNLVAWQLGDENHTRFRGGNNRLTGEQSQVFTAPIIAIKGANNFRTEKTPALTNSKLFIRDRYTCAYCGKIFPFEELTRDHVIPRSKGGKDVWTNVVTACDYDNHRKADYMLSEIGMELLYVPYTPSTAEHLILRGRNILPIQAEYLSKFIPPQSRSYDVLQDIIAGKIQNGPMSASNDEDDDE
jgi:5-methylcytosine-specific restriction endonuclease McrA